MQTVTASSWHLHKASLLSPSMTETLPSEFEVVVMGTGLVESMVAAASARMGHTTLHVDTAKYYGGDWAAFTWDGLQEWIRGDERVEKEENDQQSNVELEEGEELVAFGENKTIVNVQENWYCDKIVDKEIPDSTDNKEESSADGLEQTPAAAEGLNDINTNETFEASNQAVAKDAKPEWNRETLLSQSRKFNLDLTPRLLFARGPMVELLISSNISRYTEFKSVTRVLTLLEGRLEQVPSSRSDVFNTKHISVVEKRVLMKFLTQCLQEEEGEQDTSKTFGDYLKSHKLTPNLTHFVVHSIAMTPLDCPQSTGLQATRKFLSSLGRFGPTPFLWSMYGTGELPQAFCRLCAVFGGIYYLGRSLEGVVVKDGKAKAVVTEGKRISCQYLVMPGSKVPTNLVLEKKEVTASRAMFLTKESLLPTEKEQITFLSLPQEDDRPVRVVEVGPGTAACPKGLHVMHATVEGEVGLEDIMKDEGIIKEEELVYSLTFTQVGSKGGEKTKLENMWGASGPVAELDFDVAIEQAREIYKGMFPGEDFLPRAPDPEEIILGGEEGEEKDNMAGDSNGEVAPEKKKEADLVDNDVKDNQPTTVPEDGGNIPPTSEY